MQITSFGSHVTSAPTATGDLFFMSSASALDGSAPIRGGLPLVAPWFSRFLGEDLHGWVRTSTWNVTDSGSTLSDDNLSFSFTAEPVGGSDDTDPDGYRFSLSCTNDGSDERTIQLAFHPYFAVSSVADVVVRGLDGVDLTNRLDDSTAQHSGDFTYEGLTDVLAAGSPQVVIEDATRTITLTPEGADGIVLWNPGAQAGANFDDLGEGEWDKFVCVEPVHLGTDLGGFALAAGETATIALTATTAPR